MILRVRPSFVLGALLLLAVPACSRDDRADKGEVRTVVLEFGRRLQQVSLSADPGIVVEAIREHYGPLVTPSLIEAWVRDPTAAPGRWVSSPWPDRIEIDSLWAESPGRYRVRGRLVELTSADAAGGGPGIEAGIVLVVEKHDGRWSIAEYSGERGAPGAPGTPGGTGNREPPDEARTGAIAVLTEYYDAINDKDYARAHVLWAAGGDASGQTLEEFSRGFGATESVVLTIGSEPGEIEGAAGSQYIDIPVSLRARHTGGEERRFAGTYTLRRSLVDGATADQRKWRIFKADIREGR